MQPSAEALGAVTVTGSRKQQAETALTLHRAGKTVTVVDEHGDETELHDYHTYSLVHRDTYSRIRTRPRGAVHVEFDGNTTLHITGSVLDL